MLGILRADGFVITELEEEADVIVINTCCFIEDAMKESIDTILGCIPLKTEGNLKALIVAGCLAQRYKDEILSEFPEVDAAVGTGALPGVLQAVRAALEGRRVVCGTDPDAPVYEGTDRVRSAGGAYGYLKIAEGCEKNCTYCILPHIKGHYRSEPMENLLKEANFLAESGVRELVLVAQDTTLYGTDLYGEKSLHILLRKLCGIDGIRWIRLLYAYPEEIYPELIRTIAEEPKICRYLDLPIQHASDSILKRMNRRTTQADIKDLITRLREEIPGIILRTTLITGFPAETEEDHQELLAFIKEQRFDRLGVFCYSKEEGTPAAKMKGQIPKRVKEKRRRELMLAQQRISGEKMAEMIGKDVLCMTDGYLPDEDVYEGRTYGDAPGADGLVFFTSDRELMTGDMVTVRVTGASEYDLKGEVQDEYTE